MCFAWGHAALRDHAWENVTRKTMIVPKFHPCFWEGWLGENWSCFADLVLSNPVARPSRSFLSQPLNFSRCKFHSNVWCHSVMFLFTVLKILNNEYYTPIPHPQKTEMTKRTLYKFLLNTALCLAIFSSQQGWHCIC